MLEPYEYRALPIITTKKSFIMKSYLNYVVFAGSFFLAGCSQLSPQAQSEPDVSIGVIADCQYDDREPRKARQYALSDGKLQQAVDSINGQSVDWTVHLGDFIDKDYANYQKLLPIWNTLAAPGHHVLGNHDFSVEEHLKDSVPDLLGMPARYHDFSQGKWRFVIIDGNDLSLYAYPKSSELHKASEQAFANFQKTLPQQKELHTYNGALGSKQLTWLKGVLEDSKAQGQQVVLFSHFPIFPQNAHNLWNDHQIIQLLEQYSGVFAWFNGHNHTGNYGFKNGIHYLTFKAMVNNKTNAFGIANFYPDRIEILGQGRQKSMTLPQGKAATFDN